MTTIAFDGRMIAGDRAVSFNNLVTTGATKITITKDGRMLGGAGSAAECEVMIEWLSKSEKRRGPMPDFQKDDETSVTIMEVLNDGTLMVWQTNGRFEIDAPFAFGSGAHFAIGAMAAGKNAAEAVSIAARYDAGTGGEIDAYEMNIIE